MARAGRGHSSWIGLALLVFLLTAISSAAATRSADQDIVVHVQKHGQDIAVDVDCPVDAPRAVVWAVLTDYDHMAQFISNLDYSRVEARAHNLLRVHQKGKASRGPLSIAFDNVREVELEPFREIRSQLVSGEMKSASFVTRIETVDGRVHILNHGRYTPNIWVPPLIGPALIEAETQKQYGEIRYEILRRSAMQGAQKVPTQH
jgi:hypothetical protein